MAHRKAGENVTQRVIGGLVIVALVVVLALESGIAPGAGLQVLPFLLLLAAALFLGRAVWPGRAARTQTTFAVPLAGAERARLNLTFGAGDLTLNDQALPDMLICGTGAGPARTQTRREGTAVSVVLRQPFSLLRGRAAWTLALSPAIAWESIRLQLGASTARLDLGKLTIGNLTLEIGGTTLEAILPAAGRVTLHISGGRARLRIPMDIAAVIHSEIRLGEVIVDEAHFRPDGGGMAWATPGVTPETAALAITLKGGLGTVEIAPLRTGERD